VRKIVGLIFCTLCLFLFAVTAMAGNVNLSVAASMKDAINELADGFVKNDPGVKFLKNYGASGALAKQIENGAPADIFVSANLEWMDYLKKRNLVDTASITPFAGNTLVFAGAEGKASSMQDLLKLEKIAIGSPKSVPAGEYAMAALVKAGIDKRLEKKLVMARDVRDCLMYAERGEVDGAFVYRTDALMARQAKVLFVVPRDLYPQIVYPMALTVTGAKNGDARSFYRYLQSEAAKAVLAKYGFTIR
jgi:molybdate transport system substrate-binding protein